MTFIFTIVYNIKLLCLWISSIATEKKWVHLFLSHSRAADSVVSCLIWHKFKCIQDFMVALLNCKNEEDPFKYEGTRVVTTFQHCMNVGIFQTLKGS